MDNPIHGEMIWQWNTELNWQTNEVGVLMVNDQRFVLGREIAAASGCP